MKPKKCTYLKGTRINEIYKLGTSKIFIFISKIVRKSERSSFANLSKLM